MPNDTTLLERKKSILAEGAIYRLGIMDAKQLISANLEANALAKSAMHQIGSAAYAAFRNGALLTGIKPQSILPLIITGVSALSRRSLLKPLLRGAVVLGTLAAVAVFAVKRKNAHRQQVEESL
jgi:hypothetical protein